MAHMSTAVRFPLHATTLDNGLRVIVSPDRTVPMVAVNIWFDVGSRDERPGRTGLAPLTKKRARWVKPGLSGRRWLSGTSRSAGSSCDPAARNFPVLA